ncbi:MAG TPA: phosphate ABC transporter substrate-binding protein [Xanthomonadales bacterium]|nr:phosphate ABC transporter substrate-binding protein [Xanthomonadales bacterium]
MHRTSARAALVLVAALASTSLAACSSKTQDATGAGGSASGTITVAGSTALLPLVKDASAAYQDAHKDVKISVSGGGSATGITQVAAKAIDIGDSDILAVGHPELIDHRVAVVGFAIVTNPSAGVKSLTRKQLQGIFSGKVANWNAVGGPDQKVVAVNRPRSSGTRAVFIKTIMGSVPISESGLVQDATGTVISAIKQTPGAVSYVALSGISGGGVTIVAVDGVMPTPQTIETGKYPIWSYEHMYTYGEPKGDVAGFIDFVKSGTDRVQQNKFIATSAMKVTETDR